MSTIAPLTGTMTEADLAEYFVRVKLFRERIGRFAESVDFILKDVLTRWEDGAPETLELKIAHMEKYHALLQKQLGENDLLANLRRFNAVWTIVRHGVEVSGDSVTQLTFHQDGVLHVFDWHKVDRIKKDFTVLLGQLSALQSHLAFKKF